MSMSKIDGRKLAHDLLSTLKADVSKLNKQKIIPALAVIEIGSDLSSKSYVKQKIKAAKEIGAKIVCYNLSTKTNFEQIAHLVTSLNSDKKISGIIIQRPNPPHLSSSSLNKLIDPKKDVDGFLEKSPFDPPVALAVIYVLKHVYQSEKISTLLKRKKIVLIGRGETAGKPIAKLLCKERLRFINIHSKAENSEEFKKEADIIISAVGKKNILTSENIKSGAVLIGVGIHRENNQICGDYDQAEIENKALYFTPTPGGIGPLNVAFLIKNVVEAAIK